MSFTQNLVFFQRTIFDSRPCVVSVFKSRSLKMPYAVGSLWPRGTTIHYYRALYYARGGEAVLNLEQTACFSNVVCGGHIRSTTTSRYDDGCFLAAILEQAHASV